MDRYQKRVLKLRNHVLDNQTKVEKTQLPAFDDLVKRDIKAMLDDGGVEYDERATKKELYEKLNR